MQLSIIVINYNTFDLTTACLRSIQANVRGVQYEVIVVDNGSFECSPEAFKKLFPSITLVVEKVNLGFAGGNNSGLAHAKGDVVLLLNSDTEIVGNAVETTYNYLISKPEVAVVSCKLVYPSGTIQGCCQRFPSVKLELLELLRLQKLMTTKARQKIMQGFFFDHLTEMEADWVWGTFFMVKREVIAKLKHGKLADDYFMYVEDMQWCYLIRQMGYKVMYYPKGFIIHYLSMSSTNDINFDKQKLMMNNEFSFLKSYYGVFSARIIFILRSINYYTLAFRNRKFFFLGNVYIRRGLKFN